MLRIWTANIHTVLLQHSFIQKVPQYPVLSCYIISSHIIRPHFICLFNIWPDLISSPILSFHSLPSHLWIKANLHIFTALTLALPPPCPTALFQYIPFRMLPLGNSLPLSEPSLGPVSYARVKSCQSDPDKSVRSHQILTDWNKSLAKYYVCDEGTRKPHIICQTEGHTFYCKECLLVAGIWEGEKLFDRAGRERYIQCNVREISNQIVRQIRLEGDNIKKSDIDRSDIREQYTTWTQCFSFYQVW